MNDKLLDLANGEGNYLLGDTIYSKEGEVLGVIPKMSAAEQDLELVAMKEAELDK